jgi:hypothetical protein
VSGEEDSVQYHVDYAELYRYETGIIHTPALAGTIHLSPIAEGGMEGGEFMCNSEGVEHYRRFGYKGNLAPQELLADLSRNENWMTVAYRADRGILHTGDTNALMFASNALTDALYPQGAGLICRAKSCVCPWE